MTETVEVVEVVQRAADWLDEIKPGWDRIIDIPTLNMMSSERCIAGQAFADDATRQNVDCGCLDPSGYCYITSRISRTGRTGLSGAFSGFRDSWVALILARREEVTP
jgi:hypothetical protein